MKEVEKAYDGLESREWKMELVGLLAGMVCDYLKGEGLLRADDKLTEKARGKIEEARRLIEDGGRWEAGKGNNPCVPEDTNIY
jgi:hypothetical protein